MYRILYKTEKTKLNNVGSRGVACVEGGLRVYTPNFKDDDKNIITKSISKRNNQKVISDTAERREKWGGSRKWWGGLKPYKRRLY